jgi:hypothetical protein
VFSASVARAFLFNNIPNTDALYLKSSDTAPRGVAMEFSVATAAAFLFGPPPHTIARVTL